MNQSALGVLDGGRSCFAFHAKHILKLKKMNSEHFSPFFQKLCNKEDLSEDQVNRSTKDTPYKVDDQKQDNHKDAGFIATTINEVSWRHDDNPIVICYRSFKSKLTWHPRIITQFDNQAIKDAYISAIEWFNIYQADKVDIWVCIGHVVNDLHKFVTCPKCYEDLGTLAMPGTLFPKDPSSVQTAFGCHTCTRQTNYTVLIDQLPRYCIERCVGFCPTPQAMINFLSKAHLSTSTQINEYIAAYYKAKAADKLSNNNMKTPPKMTDGEKATSTTIIATPIQVTNATAGATSPPASTPPADSANIEDQVAMLTEMINKLSQENHELKATIANMTAEVSKLQSRVTELTVANNHYAEVNKHTKNNQHSSSTARPNTIGNTPIKRLDNAQYPTLNEVMGENDLTKGNGANNNCILPDIWRPRIGDNEDNFLQVVSKKSKKAAAKSNSSQSKQISTTVTSQNTQVPIPTISKKAMVAQVFQRSQDEPLDKFITKYYTGFKRCRIATLKTLLKTAGITVFKLKNIRFIGKGVVAITMPSSYSATFMESLMKAKAEDADFAKVSIKEIQFDPYSTDNFKESERSIKSPLDAAKAYKKGLEGQYTMLQQAVKGQPVLTRLMNYFKSEIHQADARIKDISSTATVSEEQTVDDDSCQ